jgi:soluble lytic murein transglycosylase
MLTRYRDAARICTDPVGRLLFRLHLRPNQLTLMGLGVSLLAAAAFVEGHLRSAGLLLLAAGLFDFFDGSLARASGQVTPFGAFLDSVIDRYSDLVVLLGIVVLFARTPNARGALVAMAGLVGSIMVSYTKARAESIGVPCNIGIMERPERMICLIAGALFNLLEPALWVLAVLANVTALQRIAFTRKAIRNGAVVPALVATLLLLGAPVAGEEDVAPPSEVWAPPAQEASAEETTREPDAEEREAGTPAAPVVTPAPAAPAVVPAAAVAKGTAGIPEATERAWAAAVAAYQEGNPGPLIREFGTEVALKSPITDYTRYLLAEALSRRGDLIAGRATATAVADRHRDSQIAPAALILGARLASQAGDEAAAQQLLVRLIDSYPQAPELPQALYLLGMTAEARGDREAAAAAYRHLTVLLPTTGYADGASDRLGVLAAAGIRVPQLSFPQRIDRAERLLKGGVPQTAAEEAERIAKETRDPGIAERALKVVADASYRLRRYDVAARAFELAIDRTRQERKASLRMARARALWRSGRPEQALPVLDIVTATGAESEAAEALFLKGSVLEDMNRNTEATALYRRLAARYPARHEAGAALWRLGWLAYLAGDTAGAAQAWTRLAQIPGGRSYRVSALYWTGRATERKSGLAAAKPLYIRVMTEAPRSYYGGLAARRVAPPRAATADLQIRLPNDPSAAVAADPAFVRVALLRRIGLVEYAWQELEELVRRSVGDTMRLYALSGTYMKEERYDLALRILRRHFGSLASTGHASLPRAFWEMLYPFGWEDHVREAAERSGLDPFLVAAVVREESGYYPRAVSPAGARGLMQLMPGTAQPMAEVRGLPFRNGDLLYDPVANLQIGTSFLAGLMKEFGDPRLALAAYNAGPRRAREWWKARRSDDVEVWVEQIPYDETRLYVRRVMLSWDEYRRIYSAESTAPSLP